jgi:uncharacterized membrane protein YeiH
MTLYGIFLGFGDLRMITETILLILEIVGTIAFAVSGAFVAIKVRFDIFGVVVIGCVTSFGGGIIRDLLIGSTPPAIFSRWYMILIAISTSVVVFLIAWVYRKKFDEVRVKIENVNNIFDAFGLAAFTVMGTELAFSNGLQANPILAVSLGVLTGVGGGVLRDVLTETPPYIFKKHVYALASITGGALYYGLRLLSENTLIVSCIAMAFIIVLRLLARKYRWSLPKIHLEKNNHSNK